MTSFRTRTKFTGRGKLGAALFVMAPFGGSATWAYYFLTWASAYNQFERPSAAVLWFAALCAAATLASVPLMLVGRETISEPILEKHLRPAYVPDPPSGDGSSMDKLAGIWANRND